MKNHEEIARKLHKAGNNCSNSLHNAFSEDTKLSSDFPAPRSIDGKCGALLTAKKILEELGHRDKLDELEKEFINKFGYTKCIELMRHEARCNDYVGECAKIIDNILENEYKGELLTK